MYEEADEETEDNLYVHHDVIVPYFPLSVAWLDIDPSGEQLRAMRAACIQMSVHVCESSVLDNVPSKTEYMHSDVTVSSRTKCLAM